MFQSIMKLLLFLAFIAAAWQQAHCGAMTEAQMKAALKLVRNVCQPKYKTTNEQIDAMHKGDWEQDRAGQCYMWCILNMYKMMTKDNKFDWETAMMTLNNQAPESLRGTATKSVENCKDAVKSTEKCAAGFDVAKCIYMDNPKMTKDNKFDWENAIVALNTQAPETVRDTAIKTVRNCKDAIKSTEKCAAGFEVAKCIYMDNPQAYFLP